MGDGLGLSHLPGISFDEMAAGTVTPRPSQVNDDSELGYLAYRSGNASGESISYFGRTSWSRQGGFMVRSFFSRCLVDLLNSRSFDTVQPYSDAFGIVDEIWFDAELAG